MNYHGGRGRPRLGRRIGFEPQVLYFKPQGVPISRLRELVLSREELEAMRLKNIENLDQAECAKRMNTSPATLQRILTSAYQKITQTLVEGSALRIEE